MQRSRVKCSEQLLLSISTRTRGGRITYLFVILLTYLWSSMLKLRRIEGQNYGSGGIERPLEEESRVPLND